MYLPLFQQTPVNVFVFENVENAEKMRQELIGKNPVYDYAFIDASSIVSVKQIYSAIMRALQAQLDGQMKSKTLHTEVILSLSPKTEISSALRQFGMSVKSTKVLVVKINGTLSEAEEEAHVDEIVQGARLSFSDETFQKLADMKVIKKNYKLDAAAMQQPLGAILSAIALRGYS
ncbi:CGI121 family protein [Schizosaccharomyces cryophilus OY26]|uniref:EKC/KEOPS complex subunit CGI121 n=1 Tax=Schizosaccharomyces cryophilus (strain OY26 / ATCC MYA-4695 / CBS 11777 / NBRC 106824 / NRRL Y48691) TaxID=653667 RepID=S9VP63_SCHCR|nr:CGI121 family protein [Schizosaccharomyces cryophilus OY26]EPY49773.1 CGI121 family protein [Schizosaccharomyces cryophilus OY26]